MLKKVLVIDDEIKLRTLVSRILILEGYDVIQAASIQEATKILENKTIDLVLCDVKLPDGNGIDFIPIYKAANESGEIIMLTAYGNIPDGVQAIRNGAFDYITKGDDNSKVIPLIARAFEKVSLTKRVRHLESQLENKYTFDTILGSSQVVTKAIDLAQKVANSDTTVLLSGETGTGKEVFAQAIHYNSHRKNKNFIAINCSAFGKDLLESELFGHVSGAFTGAKKDKTGLFSEANHGTIFLDEIGDLAHELQAKLLRVIETGEFYRVGDSKALHTDVRIIAATNKDLQQEIASGNFRKDLFYRISTFEIHLPPLRDRKEDIEALAIQFLKQFSNKSKKKIDGFTKQAFEFLKEYAWPGNIRELRNVVERAVILTDNSIILADDLAFVHSADQLEISKLQTTNMNSLASMEKAHIASLLKQNDGNKSATAQELGIAISTLYRKMAEYKLE